MKNNEVFKYFDNLVVEDDKVDVEIIRRGLGNFKGLFERIATYPRTREWINPRTSLADLRAFILRGGSDRLMVLGSGQPVAPVWRGRVGPGHRESVIRVRSSNHGPSFSTCRIRRLIVE